MNLELVAAWCGMCGLAFLILSLFCVCHGLNKRIVDIETTVERLKGMTR